VRQLARGAHTVFFAGLAGLERSQAAEFAFDRDTHRMRGLADAARHVDVVFVARGRLRILAQRPVHHDAGESRSQRLHADRRRRSVILVQHDRNVRMRFHRGQHHVPKIGFARVLAGAGRGLQDHRTVGLLGRLHDGLYLFEIVDVERRHAIALLGGMIQQLTEGDERHGRLLIPRFKVWPAAPAPRPASRPGHRTRGCADHAPRYSRR
jgi:hypothetical protein